MPLVSIIVPVYGVERYIERCAVSLFEQTYKDIEYIFVNDATPDKSIEVLKTVIERYPERAKAVRIVEHPQNRGVSAARNSGVEAASGAYLWQVDADDYIEKNAVRTLVDTAEQHKADVVVFDVNMVTADGIRLDAVLYNSKEDYIRRMMQHTEKCAHWNKFYRRSLFVESGIRADEQIRLADDYAVTPRLLYCAKRVAALHEPLYFYETTNQSSYMHNLSRSAIESQHRADGILTAFFADKQEYSDIVAVLPQRSMVSLIKNTDAEGWKLINEVYKDCLSCSGRQMDLVNRIIFNLAKCKNDRPLRAFMRLYHLIMR